MNEFNDFNVNIKDRIQEMWYKYKLYIIILVCLIIGLIIVLGIINNSNNIDTGNLTYKSIETIMKNNAEEYAKNNKITKSTYLSLNVLNLKIDKELKCETISGVLKESDNYYPYLVCDKYQSNKIKEIVDKNASNKSYGSLKGDNPYILTSGEYIEPGYEIDNKYKVNIKGNDIENGVNIISYYILENNNYVAELKRIVIADDVKGNAPTIELVGNRTITIPQNHDYKELGYKATDKTDGDITNKVKVTGSVDSKTPGAYKITYSVTNSRNKITTTTRTVIINQNAVDLVINYSINPSEVTGNSVTIKLDIKGNDYEKTILPNNTESTSVNPTYIVYKNDNYEFIIHDKKGNSEVYSVLITNIDSSAPTGSCEAIFENEQTNIKVTAKDISGISSYEYFISGISLNKSNQSTYNITGYPYDSQVKVTDNSGEESTFTCKITNKSPKYFTNGLNKLTHSNDLQYYLYIPPNTEIHEKQPLIVSMHGGGGIHCIRPDGEYYVDMDKKKWVTFQHIISQYLIKEVTLNNKTLPAIVVAPEASVCNWEYETKKAKQIIDDIVKKYNIDTDRISITGHSQGGAGTLDLLRMYPDFFSVAVPMSPAGTGAFENHLFTTPLWFFLSDNEYPKIVTYVKSLSSNLIKKGQNVKVTWMHVGHETDDYIFRYTNLADWMIKQEKGKPVVFDPNIESQMSKYLR